MKRQGNDPTAFEQQMYDTCLNDNVARRGLRAGYTVTQLYTMAFHVGMSATSDLHTRMENDCADIRDEDGECHHREQERIASNASIIARRKLRRLKVTTRRRYGRFTFTKEGLKPITLTTADVLLFELHEKANTR